MDTQIHNIQPTRHKDCVDFIIVSNRGISKITTLFEEAARNPEKWMVHHFIVVYDTEEECHALKEWIAKYRDVLPLPKITPCLAAPKNRHNVSALRAQGVAQGINPYVYFQDDDDPLPEGLERRMQMMNARNIMAIYGVTKSVGPRGQTIEEFPVRQLNTYAYEPVEATRLFPTYAHPLAALFNRELFKKVPIDDDNKYKCSSNNAFCVRLFASGLPVQFLPDIIRTVNHHAGNGNGIFEKNEAKYLAADIQKWVKQVNDTAVAAFQEGIAEGLLKGSITTYREIDAQVEAMLEGAL